MRIRRHQVDCKQCSFKHAITGAKSSEVVDAPGGIIADDMGLGKTLSMLAAVVSSATKAIEYAFSNTRADASHWQDITPSKSTLVVVPSACKSLLSSNLLL
jgi:SWI/SNF-related matrix-associated actin-dependent regulator of chromatin subfamily A3